MSQIFKKYIIYGVGISGFNSAFYLANQGFEVVITDDNSDSLKLCYEKLSTKLSQNLAKNVKFVENDKISDEIDEFCAVIFSAGIPLYFPKKHKILEIVEEKKAQLMCDVELFYLLNQGKNHNFIGISGTNGKSTSSALINFVFQELNISSKLAGNIGIAVFELQQEDFKEQENFVFEVSSYQLDLMKKTCFDVAALTNVDIDHIDRHGNFENYVKSKKRIFNNQKKGDFAILNLDDENSVKIYDELKKTRDNLELIGFSSKKISENGVFIVDGELHNKIFENNLKFEIENAILKGEHNMQNIALAFACVYLTLTKNFKEIDKKFQRKIVDAILKFQGLKHRMQFLGEIQEVQFINDSKATNAKSAQKALMAYENIFLILGGKPKEDGILSLKPYFNKIVKVYLIGEAQNEFGKVLEENSVDFEKAGNLENAVKIAFEDAKNFDENKLLKKGKKKSLILSPACASFDQWKNFEERGDYFCKIFNEFKDKSKN